MAAITLTVNGSQRKLDIAEDMPLLWALRDHMGLTGAKYGCGLGICGACTVLIDGEAARSCQMSVTEVQGKQITTIEGLSERGDHPLQKAWIETDVPQCGYCQAGQIMEAASLLKKKPKPTDADIDEAMKEHLCRCGTYTRIRAAIHAAAGNAK